MIFALAIVALSAGCRSSAPLARDCGSSEHAEEELEDVVRTFTDPKYATLREGYWRTLPPDVPRSVMTRRSECRRFVDIVNARIAEMYPATSVYRTAELVHIMDEIGPCVVVFFWPDDHSIGWHPCTSMTG